MDAGVEVYRLVGAVRRDLALDLFWQFVRLNGLFSDDVQRLAHSVALDDVSAKREDAQATIIVEMKEAVTTDDQVLKYLKE